MWARISKWIYAAVLGGAVAVTPVAIQKQVAPKKETVLILRGLTHYSEDGYPVDQLARELRKNGYEVRIGNHTEGNDLTKLPDILIGHSMGGNAVLKAAERLGPGPRVIVTIDPGRRPLYSTCPTHVRCVNLYDPLHPIGGQFVYGKRAENYRIKGTYHASMPTYPKVINAVVRTVNEGRK